MDGKRDTRSAQSNSLKEHDVREGDTFDDPRLDKLWNKVGAGAPWHLWGLRTSPVSVPHRPQPSVTTGKKLREVFQPGAAEPEEGISASQGQDPRVQHPDRRSEQDRR